VAEGVHVQAEPGAALRAFNAADAGDLAPELDSCLAVPRWVRTVLDGRPYPDLPTLLERAGEVAATIDDPELAAALARHPRIGAPPTGGGTEAGWSRGEQSGVDPADARLQAALREGNVAYEQRFGHVFLVRAAGRSSAEILAALRERLGNDPVTERGVVRDQLAQIATLRLSALLDRLGGGAA
jgi:2-oxo-4-hydroxy-4-carboxy-5-ureidoimidazoline decarboxylase